MENGMNGDDCRRHSRSRSPSPSLNRSNSRGSMNRDGRSSSLVRRNAKQIRFYRNGDRFFRGLKLAVSTERYKEFDALCAELSSKLDLPSGAVRFIFEAESGKEVRDVSELEYGSSYCCGSAPCFKAIPGGYGRPHHSWSVNSKNPENKAITNWDRKVVQCQQSTNKDFIKPKLVTIIKNGKPPQKKVTMLLNQKTALHLDQVLDHLSAKGTLGKVDKLCTCDCKQIRELRDLFNDDMIFIACCATERFPEDGFEVDVHNYKITPYRDLKRPCGLKRSSSLRTPRHRRESGGDGDLQRPARPVKRSSSVKSAGHSRNRSQSPGPRPNGHPPRGYRPKSPGSSSGRKTPTGSTGANDELYPAQVFEKDPSDSANRNWGPKKVIRRNKPKAKANSPDKFYSTVWLSDYEFEPDRNTEPEFSGYSQCTSPSSSHVTTPFSSEPTSPYSSRPSTPSASRSTTPSISFHHDDDSGLPSEIEKSYDDVMRPRKKLHRTHSLPDSELNQIEAFDLQERFTTLQLEQENRDLKKLTQDLQSALEKLEERVNEIQRFECDSLDEPPPYASPSPPRTFENFSSPLSQDRAPKTELPQELLPKKSKTSKKLANYKNQKNGNSKSKKHVGEDASCCMS